jgi:PAS domain S-box-containing protein
VSASPNTPQGHDWLVPRGEMGRMIAAHPWEKTPLGALNSWPIHLRTATNLMLRAGAPMALVWGKEFRFIYNDRYAQIIQDKHPSALGAPSVEIFPELWHILLPLFNKAIGGEAVLIEDYELPVTRLGTTKPGFFSFSYNPVAGEDGHVDGFLAVVIETTVRGVREQERAHVFDTVLSAITDFAYTFDRDGRFLYVNKALLDLWGLRLDQAVGKNFYDLKYPDDLAARLQRQIQQVITERTTVRDETRYVSPTGVEGFYEYIFSPVFGPDGSVSVVAGSTRDITARKKLEVDALAAARTKDDFIATLSHELRTPLNPVLLLATEGAENSDLPERVRADFKTIADNVAMEARLIDDLLDISRITHGKLQLNLLPHDLHAILAGAIEIVLPDLQGKELALTKRFAASPSVIVGDKVRLHQIFSNLLRNAVKFTPRGGRVSISTSNNAADAKLIVEISDTGIGLTPTEIAEVFKPFAQGEHAVGVDGGFGGLGLGLAISEKVAEMHSGSIVARSPGRDQGATFTVTLPSSRLETPPSDDRTNAASTRRRPGGPKARALLVEDHDSSRHVLARLLASRGIETVQAASASEALAAAKANSFDFVISDIGLPDGNGYDLMAGLRDGYGLVGIALSGFGAEKDITRSKAAGFVLHLTKPVQVRLLDEALEKIIQV